MKFYNYVYVDLLNEGKFIYKNIPFCFLYKPFYVGKGTGDRYKQHIKDCNKGLNHDKCKYILRGNFDIIKFNYTDNENSAFMFERILIQNMWSDLTNKKDKGKRVKVSSRLSKRINKMNRKK